MTKRDVPRWIHCTPLLGQNGAVGVWMIVLVEDENAAPHRKFRQPLPVDAHVRATKSELEMFDPQVLPAWLRRRSSQDAIYRDYNRPRTRASVVQESLESFTIKPA